MHRLYVFSLKIKFGVLIIHVAIESLLYIAPSHAKDNFLHSLKH